MDITFMLWAAIALTAMVVWFQNRVLRRMAHDHHQFERVMALALKDLDWRGVKITARGFTLDADASARDAGLE